MVLLIGQRKRSRKRFRKRKQRGTEEVAEEKQMGKKGEGMFNACGFCGTRACAHDTNSKNSSSKAV